MRTMILSKEAEHRNSTVSHLADSKNFKLTVTCLEKRHKTWLMRLSPISS